MVCKLLHELLYKIIHYKTANVTCSFLHIHSNFHKQITNSSWTFTVVHEGLWTSRRLYIKYLISLKPYIANTINAHLLAWLSEFIINLWSSVVHDKRNNGIQMTADPLTSLTTAENTILFTAHHTKPHLPDSSNSLDECLCVIDWEIVGQLFSLRKPIQQPCNELLKQLGLTAYRQVTCTTIY